MKNVHILTTDQPSRLYLHSNNELQLRTNIIRTSEDYLGTNQNIYITSDEEIKDCWVLNSHINEVYFLKGYYGIQPLAKKIILTTDQDLIKDGVQSIDDEFLEWFVKNPSCEKVEVRKVKQIPDGITYGMFGNDEPPTEMNYKIIIPQEEPKQEMPIINGSYGCIIETNKQETLKEAAERYARFNFDSSFLDIDDHFIAGAEWRQERLYSEEDLKEAFRQGQDNMDYSEMFGWDSKLTEQQWFEQFKKK